MKVSGVIMISAATWINIAKEDYTTKDSIPLRNVHDYSVIYSEEEGMHTAQKVTDRNIRLNKTTRNCQEQNVLIQ